MAKYKIVKNFTDKHNKKVKYKIGDVVEFDSERAKEILSVDKLIQKIAEPKKAKEQSEE